MFIVPHGAPEGYEWFVALVVLVGLCFDVCTFMRNAKPLDGLCRERLPAPNPVRPGPGPEDRLRDLQRRFHAVTRANELRPYYRSAKIAAVAAILVAVVWGLSLPFGGASRAIWHNPDLYFVLFLLTGLATFLAIIYECIQKFRRRKPLVVLPLDGLQRDHPAPPTEESKQPSDYSQLFESPSRVREHFGVFGGARPAEGRGRKGKRP